MAISTPVPSADSVERVFSATKAAAISKSDTVTFEPTRGLYTGDGGNVTVLMAGDTANVTLVNVAAGIVLPVSVTAVRSTGTTNNNFVALR